MEECFVFENFQAGSVGPLNAASFPPWAPFNFSACPKSKVLPLQEPLVVIPSLHCIQVCPEFWLFLIFKIPMSTSVLISGSSLKIAPCHSSKRYGECLVWCWLVVLGKSLTCQIPALVRQARIRESLGLIKKIYIYMTILYVYVGCPHLTQGWPRWSSPSPADTLAPLHSLIIGWESPCSFLSQCKF
jgi:hypothetical protein